MDSSKPSHDERQQRSFQDPDHGELEHRVGESAQPIDRGPSDATVIRRAAMPSPDAVDHPGESSGADRSVPLEALPMADASGVGQSIDSDDASAGSTRRRVVVVPEPKQDTVLSKRPPLGEPIALPRPLRPFELGKTLEGKKLNHFQLTEFVGGGGMGAVFRAHDEMLSRTVAVKVLSSDRTDEETLRRFQNEAQSAARLDHPNIARVHYVGEDCGYHFIVFEYIEGVNIRDLVEQKGPLPIEELLCYAVQVAEALQHAATRDVVHRDIKPSNLLVTPEGRIKLVDMGLARLHQVEAAAEDLTASGVTLGTFDYISPEQAKDPRSADVRSDLYSLGCTIYYMLTGRPPFPAGTVLQKLLSHSGEQPTDVRGFRADVPEDLCRILDLLLAKQPTQRFQSAEELVGALLVLADRLGYHHLTEGSRVWIPQREPRPWLRRQLHWLLPVALLLMIAMLVHGLAPATLVSQPPPSFASSKSETRRAQGIDQEFDAAAAGSTAPRRADRATESSGTRGDVPSELRESKATDLRRPEERRSEDRREERGPSTPLDRRNSGNARDMGQGTATELFPRTSDAASGASGSGGAESNESPGVGATSSGSSGSGLRFDPQKPESSRTEIRYLIVGESRDPVSAESLTMETLEEAVRYANQNASVDRIELAFSGEVDVGSLEIQSRRLTIHAGLGATPVLVFRSSGRSSRYMFRVGACDLMFGDLELRFEVAQEVSDAHAMFLLDRTPRLQFQNSVLTIQASVPSAESLAFVQFTPPRAKELMPGDDTMNTGTPPLIDCFSTIVRGQATMLRVPEGIPFRLKWDQGLFITTERLLDIAGSRVMPRAAAGGRIDLSNTTAVVGKGLVLMRVDSELRYPLEFSGEFFQSIVVCNPSPQTLVPAPLVEMRAATGSDFGRKRPYFRSRDSFYHHVDTILRLDRTGNPNDVLDYTFYERENASELKWDDAGGVVGTIPWRKLPSPSLPADRQSKNDYLLDEAEMGQTMRAGFDPARLPDPVRSPETTTRTNN